MYFEKLAEAAEAADEVALVISKRGFFAAWAKTASEIPFRLLSDDVSGCEVPGFVGVADLELFALPLHKVCQVSKHIIY